MDANPEHDIEIIFAVLDDRIMQIGYDILNL